MEQVKEQALDWDEVRVKCKDLKNQIEEISKTIRSNIDLREYIHQRNCTWISEGGTSVGGLGIEFGREEWSSEKMRLKEEELRRENESLRAKRSRLKKELNEIIYRSL